MEAVDESTGALYYTARKESPLESHLYRSQLNSSSAANPTRITEREGMHDIEFSSDARSYLDTYSSPQQPKQVSLHGPTGNHLAWLSENKITEDHPLSPYLRNWRYPEFGELEASDGQTLYYKMTNPATLMQRKNIPCLCTFMEVRAHRE